MPQNPNPTSERLGPRPLALHLAVAAMIWATSRAALTQSRNGWPDWRPELRERAEALGEDLKGVDPDAFADAVHRAALRAEQQFLAGVECYRHHPYRRALSDPPAVWQQGSSRLLDYGPADGAPVLVVPSLVNRGYVLDLTPARSLLRYLSSQGQRPFLVDWGEPGEAERAFGLDDYITGRLDAMLSAARDASGGRSVAVLGYCMGGLFTVALAQRRAEAISGLALLAVPWDFHLGQAVLARQLARSLAEMSPMLDRLGGLPVDALQTLFLALDPQLGVRKFSALAELDPESDKARHFVALEDWLNDGVPLVPRVARECLIGWYGDNAPVRGEWRVGGQPVRPQAIDLPALVMIPDGDRIVPPPSAEALAGALGNVERRMVRAGHIGMVVGSRARGEVWKPLAEWLSALADEK